MLFELSKITKHTVEIELPFYLKVVERSNTDYFKVYGYKGNALYDRVSFYPYNEHWQFAQGLSFENRLIDEGSLIEKSEYKEAFDRFFDFIDEELKELCKEEIDPETLSDCQEEVKHNQQCNKADDLNKKDREAA